MRHNSVGSVVVLVMAVSVIMWPCSAKAGPQDQWHPVTNWVGFSSSMGMALGTNGLIYIAEAGANRIRVVDTNGVTRASWTGFDGPSDVATSSDGFVYVCDSGNDLIRVFDHAGVAVTNWGGSGTADGKFSSPKTVSILRSGNVVVADAGNYRIQIFTPMGVFVRKWGRQGEFEGQFHSGLQTEVGVDNLIYANEDALFAWPAYRARVQAFDESGSYIRTFSDDDDRSGVSPYISRGLNALFFSRGFGFGTYGFYAHGGSGGTDMLQCLDGDYFANGHVLELSDGTLVVSTGDQLNIFRRYYRQYSYNPVFANSVPVPAVMKAEQRTGTTWMDIDYIVYDGNDSSLTVGALAFTNGGSDLNSVVKVCSLVENTSTNIGPNMTTGVMHHLTWNVAADLNSEYANVQVEVFAKDTRELMDFHFVTIPATGTNTALTINKSALGDADFLNIWMWLIATGDPTITLVNGTVLGLEGAYATQVLASGASTTAKGRAFVFERLHVAEVTADEMKLAVDARAISGDESTYWVKTQP